MLERAIALGVNGKDIETSKPSLGVALVIIGIDPSRNGENATQPRLWTIREKKDKLSTGKIAGQISLPGETRKITGEPIGSNIGGALAEFTDNSFTIVNNLFLMPESFRIQGKLFVNKNPFDIVVLMHEGPFDRSIEPLDKEEVSANGWMTMDEIGKVDPHMVNPYMVRGFVWDIIFLEKSEGIISKTVSEYFHNPTKRVPVSRILPQDFFSIENFYKQREGLQDVIPH